MWSREDTLRNAIWNSQHCKPIFFYKANSNDVCFVQLVCFLDCAIGYPLYAGHVSVLLTSTYWKSWKSWNKESGTSIFWKSFHLAVIYLATGQCADNLIHLLLSGYLGSFYSYSMHHVILCFHVIYPRHQPKLSFMFAKHWPYLLRGKGRSNLCQHKTSLKGVRWTNSWPHWRRWNFAIDFVGFKFFHMNSSTLLQEQWTTGFVNRQSTIQCGVCSSPSPVKLCWAVSWAGLCNKLLLSMKVKKEIICFCPKLFIHENNPTQSKELLRSNRCIAASLMESDSHTIFTSLWCCQKIVSRQKC